MNSTILIVDDMKVNIDMLTSILRENHTIMAAISGENAIKLLERRKPDLVLLDIAMPGVDGFGVLGYMKNRTELARIPVIFVTGEHDSEVEERGILMGAVDYIKKPYNAAVVSAKVRNHLELKSYRDNLEQLVYERTSQLAASREAIIMGMSLMSESHDKITGDHVMRIKDFTKVLAEKIMEVYPDIITEERFRQIVLYSPLHDVGKVGISDTILLKTGLLTPEEFNIMKTHTLDGAELLRKTETFLNHSDDSDDLGVAIEIAECHHERFDGTGYPHGMKGDEIPMSARIVAVADVYDALRSSRPYKKAYTHQEAVDIINSENIEGGKCHFDPSVLSVFQTVGDAFDSIYR